MSRLDIKNPSRAQTVVDNLTGTWSAASPPVLRASVRWIRLKSLLGSCASPVLRQVRALPHRPGTTQQAHRHRAGQHGSTWTPSPLSKTARSILNTADCAIGRDAARLVLDGLEGFRDDYEEHVTSSLSRRLAAARALRGPVSRRGGRARLYGAGGRGTLRRRGAAHP